MAKAHIAIIDPSVTQPEIDVINHLSLLSPLPTTTHMPALFGTTTLQREDQTLKGIIVLGSASSVNDRFPWQIALGEWLVPQMKSGIPTLGICFGHQFIHSLFGGKVEFLFEDRRKHLGFHKVSLQPNPLWGNQPMQGEVCVSHREGVVIPAPDFESCGTRQEIKNEAFVHKSLPIWTFQSHPEATGEFLDHMKIPRIPEQSLSFGHGLVQQFLNFCANREAR